jgi:serine/threonine protein kinase
MGVVYRGVHEHLGRQVAIKALAPELTQQPEFKERFFSEAKTQARLQHPNIVGVYDLLEDNGEYFIVMELVAGEGLDGLLHARAGQSMDLMQAMAIFSQVLSALDYAHSEGVIHRDIKPSNVMITAGGRVKLTDFGIALLIGDKRLTASQSAIGTPTYMSPEQILRPRSVDHRIDLYSAAVVFYEMLAGKPPFDDETEYGIKKLHVEAPPPDLSTLHPGLPPGVVQAVATALSKNPDDRFASAGLFLRALQEAVPLAIPAGATPLPVPAYRPTTLDSMRIDTAPPKRGEGDGGANRLGNLLKGRNRWIAIATAAVLVLAVGFGSATLILSSRKGEDQADASVSPEPVPQTELTGGGGTSPAVPPSSAAQTMPLTAAPGELTPTPLASPAAQTPLPPPAPATQSTTTTTPPIPKPTRKKVTESMAQPAAEPTPPPVEGPKPAAPSVPEPKPQETPAPPPADAGLDQFKAMESLVLSIESFSKKTLNTYENEGKEDLLLGSLEDFSESAVSLRREFRKVTGTGLRGFGQNLKGIFRKGGGGTDTKALEIKIDDLVRKRDAIDSLMASNPPGQTTQSYWKEVRSNLGRLKGYF